ncbi:MAG TPA: molybdopterin-dependent oxidoreductase [Thermoplasmata archaeon]|nr:molybdopterin-dependent oxidoreductase [Thermoplasmata archaeon]
MAGLWEDVRTFLRKLPWYRFAAGVVAGAGALFVTFLLRSFGLGVFLPEIAVDFTVGRIPGQIESFFIHTLGEGAKFLALLTALAVFLVLPGIYATFFRRVQRWLKKRWYVVAFYAFSSAGLILVVILPLLSAGFFGAATFAGFGFATFSQLLGAWVYAALLDYLLVDVAAEHPTGFNLSRRQFIAGTIAAVAVAAFTLYGLASLVAQKGRLVFASITEMMSKELTPTSEFYVVTKNVIDPTVDAGSWRLSVGGRVANPSTYSYSQLLGLAAMDEFVTLECVSNEVGGNLVSTAKWTGLRLSTILQSAGLDPAADWVAFTCADDYTAAIPIAKAMDPATMVAVKMNDQPLAMPHGFPARIIVPGLYGMFHAKWLTKIEAVQGEVRGYWQQKGWTNQGQIHTTAIIATPPDNTVVQSPVTIGGIAFAGDRGITGVEVSTDGGGSWKAATLKLPPLSNLTWVLWTFDWSPSRSGSFKIVARAIDGGGMPQDPSVASPFPNGSAGFDSITLLVG